MNTVLPDSLIAVMSPPHALRRSPLKWQGQARRPVTSRASPIDAVELLEYMDEVFRRDFPSRILDGKHNRFALDAYIKQNLC